MFEPISTTPDRKFRLTENFLDSYKTTKPPWGYGDLSYVVYKRTYARIKPDGTTEEWWETVRRVVEGCYQAQLWHCERNHLPFSLNRAQRSAQKMYDHIFWMRFLPPGRGLEHMGAESVSAKGGAILCNCGFISTEDIDKDFSRPFTFMMDFSALGVGVASDTRGAGKVVIKGFHPEKVQYFEIPDSREGWVESLRILLEAGAHGGPTPVFGYDKIRPFGTRLNTLGGTASGPEPLAEMHFAVYCLLDSLKGKPITAEAIVDIHNWIGRCIVAGGTRRSAQLMLGGANDESFLDLKNPDHNLDALLSHRWASNNSILATVGMDYTGVAERIQKNGEPGLVWEDNCQHYGRMKDGYGDWDLGVRGVNPCGEQPLWSGELCNVADLVPANCDSLEQFKDVIKFAYLYTKSVTLIPTHDPNVNAIMGQNRRIGMGIMGVVDAIDKFGFRSFVNALDSNYSYIRELDRLYSNWLCIPTSIKMTTVKPNGSTANLPGRKPGVHFPHAEYYVRNVRFQVGSPMLKVLQKAGFPCEPSLQKDNTIVVSFPIHEQHYTRCKSEVSMLEQLALAAVMQEYWSDNSVSVTVTFKPEEAALIPTALALYEDKLKSVSFLPLSDHSYAQAPYIEITKEEYFAMKKKLRPLGSLSGNTRDTSEKFCTGDTCELPPALPT